jgi:Flp pilus assembly protein TadB
MTTEKKTLASNAERHALISEEVKGLQDLERRGSIVEQSVDRQPDTQARLISQTSTKRIRWGRSLLFAALLCVAAFVGLLVLGMIVG